MPKETPKYNSLLEAYEKATGRKVKEPKGPIHELPWLEQWVRWDKKQEALKKKHSAE